MTVSSNIMTMSQRKVNTKLFKSSKPISILLPTDDLDYASIKTGLMPNFIHSLDASNIHILIKQILLLNLIKLNLYTIHDCFATDYKNMAFLEILIKKSFTDLYFNQKYLIKINNSFRDQIKSITSVFEEKLDNINYEFILVDPNLIKDKNFIKKFLNSDKLIKVYLPKLPEYKWEVNKDIIKKGILFNQYFIS